MSRFTLEYSPATEDMPATAQSEAEVGIPNCVTIFDQGKILMEAWDVTEEELEAIKELVRLSEIGERQ